MNSGGESRESLDLLASAAEQSSETPQTRIKRNTACVSCRDSKVRATLPVMQRRHSTVVMTDTPAT